MAEKKKVKEAEEELSVHFMPDDLMESEAIQTKANWASEFFSFSINKSI